MDRESLGGMTTCRRCGSSSVERVRQGKVRRREREYELIWNRCEDCQDVSLVYRIGEHQPPGRQDLAVPAETEIQTEVEAEPVSTR